MTLARFEPFLKLPKTLQWAMLIVLSAATAALLRMIQLPAAFLLGPMIAAIMIETGGGAIKVPRLPFTAAQAVIGCLVARAITSEIVADFLHQWPVFTGVMLAVIVASSALGWLISKLKILPDTTAVWGLLPGAASTMMLMAEAFGADMRLVAFMQYLRVILVAAAGSLIARFWVHSTGVAAPIVWFPAIHWLPFAETLGLVVLGMTVGQRSRIPAGGILLPMILGTVLHLTGVITIELPQWFLVASYLLLGWTIGLRFTRKILAYAIRALPQILLSILVLMGFCAGLAYLLVIGMGIDPLTAYLATSPGGVDSIAIIAASSKVDMPFIMAMQMMRLIAVLMIGPHISRWVASTLTRSTEA